MSDELPKGWEKTSIFAISKPKQWKTVSIKNLTPDGYYVYGANGIIGYFTSYTHEFPTLMITCRGASCGNIHKSLPKSYINGNAMTLDNLSGYINIDYLYFFLKSADFKNVISGSAQPQITQEGLQDLDVVVAPLNEQIRIANKLDSLLAKVDAAQTRLEKIPTLLTRFRQSVLAAATSGELTREWRNGKSDFSTFSKHVLGDVATVSTGVTPLKKEMSYYEGGSIPWLTSSVTGLDLVTESEKFVTEKAVKECRLKLFNPGTLLIAMYGEGKTRGQVTEIAIEATINQACAAVVVDQKLASNQYVKICIEANYEKTRMMAGGGNQPNLNLSKVRNIPINLPNEQEQKEIVRRVESLFALADSVEKQYTEAKKHTDRLTQSLLAKAFRGELVPQDPNDEPASELLKRIQAEREIQLTSKPKRKTAKSKATGIAKASGNALVTTSRKVQKKTSIRDKYSSVVDDACKQLKGSSFSIEQFRSVSGFSGDYETLKALILNLLNGITEESEPLLIIDNWDDKTGDYRLRVKDVK